MVEKDIEKYKVAQKMKTPVLFDRGIPDSLGYSELENIPVTASLFEIVKAYPYQPVVFMMPPWKEIYVNDSERKQDFKTAVATYEAMKKVYDKLQYTTVEVPKGTLKERVKFIQGYL